MTRLLLVALALLSACSHRITEPPGARREAALRLKGHGCLLCHSLDGSEGAGPTLQGLVGREVRVQTAGAARTVTVDRDYLRASLLQPDRDIVDGYDPGTMQVPDMTPAQLEQTLRDLELLGKPAPPEARVAPDDPMDELRARE